MIVWLGAMVTLGLLVAPAAFEALEAHGLSTILMGIAIAGGLALVYWEGSVFERG